MTAPIMELRRPQTQTPCEEGWYYGRFNRSHNTNRIRPCFVYWGGQEWKVQALTNSGDQPLQNYDWFGHVPTCVESGK